MDNIPGNFVPSIGNLFLKRYEKEREKEEKETYLEKRINPI